MVVVTLRAPLRDLAGGHGRIDVEGRTVGEALRALERRHPPIAGWILDEHGHLRSHVNVFVNGARAGDGEAVGAGDVLHVLPSISGGTE